MIRTILAGIWTCAVTLAATYGAVSWQSPSANVESDADHGHGGGLETVRTRMISVPVIRSGAVQGYVMAQFSFSAQAAAIKKMPVKPDVVVLDEAFKAIYSEDALDFRKLTKQDLPGLAKRIVEGSNKRLGTPVVEDLFIQELNYVSKDGVRAGGRRGS